MSAHLEGDAVSAIPSAPRAPRGRLRRALLVSAFTALLVLPPVGHHLIVKSDEARFALLARDIIERGAWLDARVEGEQYRNKPPFFPWTIALLARLFGGVSEGAAQLPAAVAAVAAALFTLLLGERLFTARAGIWAAALLATSASFFSHSQQILPDMLVVTFAMAAAYAFWRAMSTPRPRAALIAFYAALALGVFAKGPVGLLPILVAATWLASESGLNGLARLWSPAGVGLFAAITLGWLLPFLAAGSQSFGQHVLWQDWLMPYLGLPLPRRLARFVGDALAGFLPWTILLPVAFLEGVRRRRNPAVSYALLSCLVPLLAIIFSRSRLPRYLLPVYPGAALLVAWWADAHGHHPSVLERLIGWASFLGIVIGMVALPRMAAMDGSGIPLDVGAAWRALPVLVCALLFGVVVLVGLSDARPALLIWGGVSLTAVLFGYGVWLANAWTDRAEDFRALATTLKRQAPDGDLRVFTQAKLLPLDFYFGRELPRITTAPELRQYLAGSTRPTVLIDQQDVKTTPPELLRDLRVLETLRIHEQQLFILGCSTAERSTGSSRCAGRLPLAREAAAPLSAPGRRLPRD
jgi:4-amino-4-deoxy-L-arabinose transferase-like glycosyltransferase